MFANDTNTIGLMTVILEIEWAWNIFMIYLQTNLRIILNFFLKTIKIQNILQNLENIIFMFSNKRHRESDTNPLNFTLIIK